MVVLLFDLVFILCYAELQHSKGEASRHHDIAMYETSFYVWALDSVITLVLGTLGIWVHWLHLYNIVYLLTIN